MPPLRIRPSQLWLTRQHLLTQEEEAEIDDSVTQIRRERIAAAKQEQERAEQQKQKLGAGLVNVIREMPAATLGAQLLASKRFRTEMRELGVNVGPEETQKETMEEALVEAQDQSRVRGECLSIAIGQLVESENTRKDQAAIIRSLRASKRRQMLWSIALSAGAVALSFAAGYLASGLALGRGL